jgi:hypothetical protein
MKSPEKKSGFLPLLVSGSTATGSRVSPSGLTGFFSGFQRFLGQRVAGNRYWDRRISIMAAGHRGSDLPELRTTSGLRVMGFTIETPPDLRA